MRVRKIREIDYGVMGRLAEMLDDGLTVLQSLTEMVQWEGWDIYDLYEVLPDYIIEQIRPDIFKQRRRKQ